MDIVGKRQEISSSMVDILPSEVLSTILSCVAMSSLADLFRCRLSCKTLRRISEEKRVLQQIPLSWIRTRMWLHQEEVNTFLIECVENDHPEPLLHFGFRHYFSTMAVGEDLKSLELATELQNTEVAYILSLIYIFTGNEDKGVKLLENTINIIGSAGIVQCRRKLHELATSN